ncbi:MAG TPA: hypothetical protein VF601_24085 [Beijerinckiaceae bacterium]|jgi:hypothetical protein
MLPYIGVCHAVAVASATLVALRPSRLDWISRLNVTIVIAWANLVLTAIVLSPGSALGRPLLFALASTALAAVSALLVRGARLQPAPAAAPLPSVLDDRPRLCRFLLVFLIVTGGLILLGNLIVALAYLPNNPDTETYRLPRIYWYRDAGSLAHFASGIDPRAIFYPFNGTLLQFPIALYHWTNRLFSLVPFAAWCVVGLTAFRIARDLGASRAVAVGTAWLAALTPGAMVQATSTNDEILAAFPLLIGVQFALRFRRTFAVADLCLALVGAALSVGTKLHAVFYWPFILAGLGWLGFRFARGERWPLVWPTRRRAALTASVLALCAVLAAGFMVPNWRGAGTLMEPSYSAQILNKPFKPTAGLQNLVLHAVQTALSPLPDLNPSKLLEQRQAFHAAFNRAFAPLFAWVNQGPDYMSVSYRFVGPSQSTGWYLGENSVDLGFSWLLLIAGLVAAVRLRDLGGIALGCAFAAWFVTYCLMTRYIEGFSVYLAYAFIVSSPVLAFAFARTGGTALRLALLAFVAVTHLVLDLNVLRFNLSRNLPAAVHAPGWPVNPPQVDAAVVEAIKAHGGARFMSNHWEVAYWKLIAPYKEGRYAVGSPHLPDPAHLNIYSVQKMPVYNAVPVRIPDKRSPGLTLIGSYGSAYGPEWAFGMGAGIEGRAPSRSGYIVLEVAEATNYGQETATTLDVQPWVWGLFPDDGLQFRYVLKAPGGEETVSDWAEAPARKLPKPPSLAAGIAGATLTIAVRRRDGAGTPVVADFPLGSTVPREFPGD